MTTSGLGRVAVALIAIASPLSLAGCGPSSERHPAGPRVSALGQGAATDRGADVSPDSTYLVFISNRNGEDDLYRMEVPAGTVTRLTRTAADESDPAVSPDGKSVAFVRSEPRGSSLWVLRDLGGKAGTATRTAVDTSGLASPAWSPDGTRILCVSGARGFVLFPAGVAAGDAAGAPAGWPVPVDASEPAWAADGTVVYRAGPPGAGDLFAYDPGGSAPPRALTRTPFDERSPSVRDGVLAYTANPEGHYRVHVLRLGTDRPEAAVELGSEPFDCFDPAVWPGGDSVVYTEEAGWAIKTRSLEGGGVSTPVPPESGNFDPVFDADARNIFFCSNRDGNDEIYVVELESYTVANLTTNPGRDAEPDFSPATHRLVFTSERDGNEEILSIDESGLDEVFLAPSPARDTDPRFSPDGTRVAFASDRAGSFDIWTVEAAGGEPVRLTTDSAAAERFPTWVEDGAAVVYQSDRGGEESLRRIPAEGGAPAPVLAASEASARDTRPSASQDGKRLIFTRERNGDRNLWILDLTAGRAEPAVTDSLNQDDAGSWSPDGATLTYQSGGAANLYRRSLTGAERPGS
jgi:Tol biopolymer transport system component